MSIPSLQELKASAASSAPIHLYNTFSFLFLLSLLLVNNKANAQSYLGMEVTRIRSEERPFLYLHQQDNPVCQPDIESRRQTAAINKAVTVCHRRSVRKQGGSPVDCLEAAQNGKSDTETDVPALVRQYGNKIAEFPRELRFGYCLIS